MSENNEENKKAVEVKMYFSSMETVLKHLAAVNPLPQFEEAMRYLHYVLGRYDQETSINLVKDAKARLEKELVSFNETISNLLMVIDTYLSLQESE